MELLRLETKKWKGDSYFIQYNLFLLGLNDWRLSKDHIDVYFLTRKFQLFLNFDAK